MIVYGTTVVCDLFIFELIMVTFSHHGTEFTLPCESSTIEGSKIEKLPSCSTIFRGDSSLVRSVICPKHIGTGLGLVLELGFGFGLGL